MFQCYLYFFFKEKTAYEMRISDWSSDVCSSDLAQEARTNMLNAMSPEDRAAFLANEERERQEKFDRIAAETERLRQARERQRQRDAEARRSTYSSSSSYGGTSSSSSSDSGSYSGGGGDFGGGGAGGDY